MFMWIKIENISRAHVYVKLEKTNSLIVEILKKLNVNVLNFKKLLKLVC